MAEREADALRLPAGEPVRAAVGEVVDAGRLHHLGCRHGCRRQAPHQVDQLADGDGTEQAAALQHRADVAALACVPGLEPPQLHRARIGASQAQQDVDRGRLARSVGAEQGHHLAGLHTQGDVVDSEGRAPALADTVEDDAAGVRRAAGAVGGRCWGCHAQSIAAPQGGHQHQRSPTRGDGCHGAGRGGGHTTSPRAAAALASAQSNVHNWQRLLKATSSTQQSGSLSAVVARKVANRVGSSSSRRASCSPNACRSAHS